MIAIIDYGAGNLFSVSNALTYLDIPHIITNQVADIHSADGVILPGVAAFPEAMQRLEQTGLIGPLRQAAAEKPFLGICLGMQMLFDCSYEFSKTAGLGLIPGEVRPIVAPGLKIPHIGWNDVHIHHRHCFPGPGRQKGQINRQVRLPGAVVSAHDDAGSQRIGHGHPPLSTAFPQFYPIISQRFF